MLLGAFGLLYIQALKMLRQRILSRTNPPTHRIIVLSSPLDVWLFDCIFDTFIQTHLWQYSALLSNSPFLAGVSPRSLSPRADINVITEARYRLQHCTSHFNTAHCTLQHCTLHIKHSNTLHFHTSHWTLYTAHKTRHTPTLHTVHIAHKTLHTLHCRVFGILSRLPENYLIHIVHSAHWMLNTAHYLWHTCTLSMTPCVYNDNVHTLSCTYIHTLNAELCSREGFNGASQYRVLRISSLHSEISEKYQCNQCTAVWHAVGKSWSFTI